MKKENKSRRQFLINSSLASLAVGLSPRLAEGRGSSIKPDDVSDCDMTTQDFYGQGPFYTADAPTISDSMLAEPSEAGQRIIISGRVVTLDCLKYIPATIIDIWHADDAGAYDNTGFNLRGVTQSNDQGFYLFETILPGKYLNGAQFRPSHIHFKITPPGFPTLTTQLYFEGDTSIPADAAASITSGQYDASARIIPLVENTDGKHEGVWDIVIDGDGISGSSNIHLDKGMIYELAPNPFQDSINIRYGVFQRSKVAVKVFDMEGRMVSSIEDQELSPEKYTATWTPDSGTANGHYFIVLQINEIQVHYQKVVLSR